MKLRHVRMIATIAAGLVSLGAHGAVAEAPASVLPGQDGSRVYCVEGLEHILPGDYYGCRALYHMQRHHYGRAISMLKEAAHWANKEAQHQLGLAYVLGDLPGIRADPARGVAWLALASERHQMDYERDYTLGIAHLTPAQQRRAGVLYLELRKQYGDAVAGKRAINRFRREIRVIDFAADGGGIILLDGDSPYGTQAISFSARLHALADKEFAGLQGSVLVGSPQQDPVHTAAPTPSKVSAAPATGGKDDSR